MEAKNQSHAGYYVLGATGVTIAGISAAVMKKTSNSPSSSRRTQLLKTDIATLSKKATRNWGKAGIAAGFLTAAAAAVYHPKSRGFIRDHAKAYGFGGPSAEEMNSQLLKAGKKDAAKIVKYLAGGLLGIGTLVGGGFAAKHIVANKVKNATQKAVKEALERAKQEAEEKAAREFAEKIERLKTYCQDREGVERVFGYEQDAVLRTLLAEEGLISEAHMPDVLRATMRNPQSSVDTCKTILEKLPQWHMPMGLIHPYIVSATLNARPEILKLLLEHNWEAREAAVKTTTDKWNSMLYGSYSAKNVALKKVLLKHMADHNNAFDAFDSRVGLNLIGRMIEDKAINSSFLDADFRELINFITNNHSDILKSPSVYPLESLYNSGFSLDNFRFLVTDPILSKQVLNARYPRNFHLTENIDKFKLHIENLPDMENIPPAYRLKNTFLFDALKCERNASGEDVRPAILKRALDRQPALASELEGRTNILQKIAEMVSADESTFSEDSLRSIIETLLDKGARPSEDLKLNVDRAVRSNPNSAKLRLLKELFNQSQAA